MKSTKTIYVIAVCVLALVESGCKTDDAGPSSDFDRTELVVNAGNNIIIPNFQSLSTAADALDASIIAFNAAPTSLALTTAQEKFKLAYSAWEHCAAFNFGPAQTALLDKNLNIFPTNDEKIDANIASTTTIDLNNLSNLDAKGLPALDYLLFGTGTDNTGILQAYTSDNNAEKRKQYLAAVSANVKNLCNTVLNAWLPSGGNYIATFTNATGTDIGSAIGLLINGIAYDLDILKNYKVAIPVGIIPGPTPQNGTAIPENVEAFYSGISASLAFTELITLEDIYLGRSTQGDGAGLSEYLQTIELNGISLDNSIKDQFTIASGKLQSLADPLSVTINTDPADVKATYTELQKLLVLLKSDMTSALGVQITFEDNDGD